MRCSFSLAIALLASVPSIVAIPTEASVEAREPALSNAQRLARGLPLLPAKLGSTIPGVTPVKAAPALRPRQSATPPAGTTPAGTTPGTTTPPVTDGFTAGAVGATLANGQPAPFAFISNSLFGLPGGGPLNLATAGTNPFFSLQNTAGGLKRAVAKRNLIGAVYKGSLAKGSANYAPLNYTTMTKPKAPSNKQGYQSSIWSITAAGDLKAAFINPNGKKAPTTLAYDAHKKTLILVGDIKAYNKKYPQANAVAVLLKAP